MVAGYILSRGKYIRFDELGRRAIIGNKPSLHRKALERSHRESLSKTSPLTTHSNDGLDLCKTITEDKLKSPHDPVWDWFELWIDYFSEDGGDASWKLTFSEPVTRLNLARRIQTEYLETYKETKGRPHLRRLIQSPNDPSAFSTEIVQVLLEHS